MIYSSDDKIKLYEAIEEAVREDKPVRFPENVYPMLQVNQSSTGPTFTIPELYWMDENRNIYQVWMQIQYRASEHCAGMYVKGSVTLDWFSSGNTSMLRAKNRYKSIV